MSTPSRDVAPVPAMPLKHSQHTQRKQWAHPHSVVAGMVGLVGHPDAAPHTRIFMVKQRTIGLVTRQYSLESLQERALTRIGIICDAVVRA